MDVKWKRYGKHEGPVFRGSRKFRLYGYISYEDAGPWAKICSVVAPCEGQFDTVVGYDGTGISFGFGQWSLTSGRLQTFIQYMKDLTINLKGQETTVFEEVFGPDPFKSFGFDILNGVFQDLDSGITVYPNTEGNRRKINRIVSEGPKRRYFNLVKVFVRAGRHPLCQEAQINFACEEFEKAWQASRRKRLGKIKTIEKLLLGQEYHPITALFFNFWQNNPKMAYEVFLKHRDTDIEKYFENICFALKTSSALNWGYNSKRVLAGKGKIKPRWYRVAKILNKVYGTALTP